MTTSFFCVFFAGVMPIFWAGLSKIMGKFQLRDNRNPREFMTTLEGRAKRAFWAQQNSWEAFAPFAAAVIIANLCQANPHKADLTAVVFVIARLLYGFCYIFDNPRLRSAVWGIGFACTVYLYWLAWV